MKTGSRKKVNKPLKETSAPVVESAQPQHLKILKDEAVFKILGNRYVYDDSFKAGNHTQFGSVHTMAELMAHLDSNPQTEVAGTMLEATKHGEYRYRRIENKKQMREAWARGSRARKMRECKTRVEGGFREDSFGTVGNGPGNAGSNSGLVGDDFLPLMGGPFNKQPYLYDYLRAHAYCFHEYHHHPLARATIHITRDFVLGGGYRVDSEDKRALAAWQAFEEVNQLPQMMEDIVKEGSLFGENLIWWLPGNEVFIAYKDRPGQEPEKGLIPRIRLIDPSTCWEIVTYPEDMQRVLFYQLVFPTQYQLYTGKDQGSPVPTSKFIFQQLPASDVMHFKYNCMSNEKRGRSDLFPVLGYLKWVRDCINYKLIALKKQAAWTEDVSVEGSQQDVDNITAAFKAMGEFEPAGSRFFHTSKITRTMNAPTMGAMGKDETIMEGISMVAAGVQIPVTYYGLAMSAGSSRAGAIVGTEPVAKKFERRQLEVKRILQALWKKFQDGYGVKGAECSVTFSEIITQDRSAKLKDIKFTEDSGYIARETAAPMAAKELGMEKDYDYAKEKEKIQAEESPPMLPTIGAPLTSPAATGSGGGGNAPPPVSNAGGTSPSAVTSADRAAISNQDRNTIQ